MFERYRQIQERRASAEGSEQGFTLIELLIVILVLGILAAIVIFALGGVSSSSAKSACKTDGKTVQTALAAYNANNGSYPTTTAALTTGNPQYLHTFPSSSHYIIGFDSGGNVYVGSNASGLASGYTATIVPSATIVAYDSDGCSVAS